MGGERIAALPRRHLEDALRFLPGRDHQPLGGAVLLVLEARRELGALACPQVVSESGSPFGEKRRITESTADWKSSSQLWNSAESSGPLLWEGSTVRLDARMLFLDAALTSVKSSLESDQS